MVALLNALARRCSSPLTSKFLKKQVECGVSVRLVRRRGSNSLTLTRCISTQNGEIQKLLQTTKIRTRNVSMSSSAKEEFVLMLGSEQHKHAQVDFSLIDFSEMERIYVDSVASLKELGNNSAAHAKAFARERLLALGMTRDIKANPSTGILFLCGHNAGRSQMAAAMLTHHLEKLVSEGKIDSLPVVSFSVCDIIHDI